MNKKSLLLKVALLSSISTASYATEYYVSDAQGSDARDCSSWNNACKSIERAISLTALDVDVIRVAEGIYKPTTTLTPNFSLKIVGGYKHGDPVPLPSQYSTIISADADNNDIDKVADVTMDHSKIVGSNRSSAFNITNVSLTLENITITGFDNSGHGSAIYSTNNSGDNKVALENVSIIGNRTTQLAPVMLYESGGEVLLSVTNSLFEGNAGDAGGVIALHLGASAEIEKSAFKSNDAINDAGGGHDAGYGGAIWNQRGNLSVKSVLFDGNTASAKGGAIYSGKDTVATYTYIDNSTFVNNDAPQGGALYLHEHASALAKIFYSTFYKNNAATSGGAIEVGANASLTLATNLILGNTSPQDRNINNPAATITDAGYNLVGFNNDSGIKNNFFDTVFVTSFVSDALEITDIIETNLADNGGRFTSLKITPAEGVGTTARNRIPNDGIAFYGEGQSSEWPFTSIRHANGAILSYDDYTQGSYYFDIGGSYDEEGNLTSSGDADAIFSAQIDGNGNVLVVDPAVIIALEPQTEVVIDDVTGKWVANPGLCNGSITTTDMRGLKRSDYVNPNDSRQTGIRNCDIGAFEWNNGYQLDCYDEDGDRPGIDSEIDSDGSANASAKTCLGGDVFGASPSALLDNFGSIQYMYLFLLSALAIVRFRVKH